MRKAKARRLQEAISAYFDGAPARALALIEEGPSAGPTAEICGWKGILLRRLDRRGEALAAIEAGLKADPKLAWLHGVRGEVLREMGGRRKGYESILAVLQADPSCAFAPRLLDIEGGDREGREEAWVLGCLGGSSRARGDWPQALAHLERAAELDPCCGWIWGWLGEVHVRLGEPGRALPCLNRAVAFFAEWGDACAWRGEALRGLGAGEGALRDLDYAVALGYRGYDVFLSRAAARAAAGDTKGYLEDLDHAVRCSPGFFEEKALELGEGEEARRIRESIRKMQAGRRLLEEGIELGRAGRWRESASVLDRCLQEDPSNAEACLARAKARKELGQADGAMADLDKVVSLHPSSSAYERRAELAQDLGYMEAALRDLSLAVNLYPTASLHRWRAQTFLGMRHYDLALKDMSQALLLEPDDPSLYELRAYLHLLLGRLQPAHEDLDEALRISPRHAGLILRKAQLLAVQRRFDEAFDCLAPIRKEHPAWTHFITGYVLCVQKRYGPAAGEFEKARRLAPESEPRLRLQAVLYGTVAKASSAILRGDPMKKRASSNGSLKTREAELPKGRVYLCGLGVYPPRTATVDVLRAVGECDVIFNNLPGEGISEFLGLFCANRRPVAFRYEQDAKLCADLILSELKPGKTVGFVTFGNPMLFGPLALEIIRRCRENKIPLTAFSAVSSMDAVLAASGQVLGYSYRGFQVFETAGERTFEEIASSNPRLPMIVYFSDGMGEEGLAQLIEKLKGLYPPDHRCLLYGPRHDLWETRQDETTLKDLGGTSHHKLAQGILFVPPLERLEPPVVS